MIFKKIFGGNSLVGSGGPSFREKHKSRFMFLGFSLSFLLRCNIIKKEMVYKLYEYFFPLPHLQKKNNPPPPLFVLYGSGEKSTMRHLNGSHKNRSKAWK